MIVQYITSRSAKAWEITYENNIHYRRGQEAPWRRYERSNKILKKIHNLNIIVLTSEFYKKKIS